MTRHALQLSTEALATPIVRALLAENANRISVCINLADHVGRRGKKEDADDRQDDEIGGRHFDTRATMRTATRKIASNISRATIGVRTTPHEKPMMASRPASANAQRISFTTRIPPM